MLINTSQVLPRLVAFTALGLSLLASSALMAGCHASAAPDAGFLEHPEVLKEDEKLPFDAVWFKEGVDLRKYKKVYVAPVDTSHLLQLDWWDKANIAPGDQDSQAKELGEVFRNEVKQQFTDDDQNHYTLVDAPDDDTLIVELAIVEVVPTKVWLNAIGYALLGALDQGMTAFEGRFKDGKTKEVIAEFKDRESGQFDIVSLADFQWNRHSRHTIEVWGDQLEEVCYEPPGTAISEMSTVTLRPW